MYMCVHMKNLQDELTHLVLGFLPVDRYALEGLGRPLDCLGLEQMVRGSGTKEESEGVVH